jgi:hypothetical protein
MTNDNKKLPVPDEMREFAERSVDQARKAVDGFMHAAQEAAGPILSTSGPFPEPLTDAGRKAMGFAEANIAASFAFAKQLINASSLDEIVALQNKFLEEQIKVMGDQVNKLHKVVITADSYKRK